MMPRPSIYYNDNDAAVCEWIRLRGYGNAIVPQAAALFIRAFDAVLTQQAINGNSNAKERNQCQNE